jgi:hypothetical protein
LKFARAPNIIIRLLKLIKPLLITYILLNKKTLLLREFVVSIYICTILQLQSLEKQAKILIKNNFGNRKFNIWAQKMQKMSLISLDASMSYSNEQLLAFFDKLNNNDSRDGVSTTNNKVIKDQRVFFILVALSF